MSKEICEWLVGERIDAEGRTEIIQSARDFLGSMQQNETLPRHPPPVGTTLEEAILRCRPPLPIREGTEANSWYGRWLGGWLAYYVLNGQIRNGALELAEAKTNAE